MHKNVFTHTGFFYEETYFLVINLPCIILNDIMEKYIIIIIDAV